jgi:tetratricopeptide (TPR) repeat protein
VSFDDLLRDLARTLADVPERGDAELRAEFIAACRRVDDDLPEQQRINEIADQFDADEALYSQAVAAADHGDADTAVPLLRRCAEVGTGEAAWLLARLLEDIGDLPDAMTWYQRAYDDGDIRAAGKLAELHARQYLAAGNAAVQPVIWAERARPSAEVNAAGGGTPHHRLAAPAMAQGRDLSRAADNAMDVGVSLVAPGRDLRVMDHSGREETTAMIARLRELLRWCPAGALGPEGSAMVLTTVATLSETLIADRDEHTALRLIRVASPHLVFLGRRHPAAFEVRRARADAVCELGYYRRAEIMLRRLSADEVRVFGSDDPRTALLLFWALVGSGQLGEAKAGFRNLEARLAQPQGADMLTLWHLRCRYSWLLGQQGLASESEASYDGVIINRSHELGEDHPDTNDARHSKGKMRVVTGDGSQAVTLLQAVADDRARVQGDRHPDTLETLKYLHLARAQAEPRDDRVLDRAINGLEHILRIQDRRHGPGYPMSRDTAEQLGKLLQLREAIRFREPIPDLRHAPGDEGQALLSTPAIAAPLGTLTQLLER